MNQANTLEEWSVALGIAGLTILAAGVVKWLAVRIAYKRPRYVVLRDLAPTLASLVYVLGARMFLQAAPIPEKFSNWLDHLAYVLGVVVLLMLVRRAATLAVEYASTKSTGSATYQQGFIPMLRNVITLFVFFTGAIMILTHFHYDVMSLITALGVGSLAVGLAAKDTLANMISGFTLIIDRNLYPGDRVNLGGGNVGDVEEIGLRSTRIRTGNGNTIIVPNADLVNSKILNLSQPGRPVVASTTFRVPNTVSFARVKATALSLVDGVEKALKDRPRGVNLTSLADGTQTITVNFWVAEPDHEGGAVSEFNEKLLGKLQSENIPLAGPPPQASQVHG